jgi:hypothetical protein
MSRSRIWGDYPELLALSEHYSINLHVYQRVNNQEVAGVDGPVDVLRELFALTGKESAFPPIYLLRRSSARHADHYDLFTDRPPHPELLASEWDVAGRRQRIRGDGNCMFRAIGKALAIPHPQMRASAVRWMLENPDFPIHAFNDMRLADFCTSDYVEPLA